MASTLQPTASTHEQGSAPRGSAGLAMLVDPHSPAAEAYRTLRVNIQFSSLDRDVRAIEVTSAANGDGKTTIVANLSVALAEGGMRVIAVDADLRRPSLHTHFGVSNEQGLTTAVLNEGAPIPLQDTVVPGLRILPSGPIPPNPVEVLGSRRLDRLIEQLRQQADYLVFDTPPAAGLSDAAILAARLDGVLLVVSAGRTRRDLARRAKEQLNRVNAHVLGVILSGVSADGGLYAY
jgi:non-specific protein-tyrosine kinase